MERIERLRRQVGRMGGDGLLEVAPPGVGALIGWAGLVEDVEVGYDDMIEEYVNDLGDRQAVQDLLAQTASRAHEAVSAVVQALDARFKAVTVDDGGEMVISCFKPEVLRGWWWQRRPISGAMVRRFLAERESTPP